MKFRAFYARLIADDVSLLAAIPSSNFLFNKAFFFRGRRINILESLCKNNCQRLFTAITRKDADGKFLYSFVNRPEAINRAALAAIHSGDMFFLQHLIEMGADKDALLRAAFSHCSQLRMIEIIDSLASVIDVNAVDEDGMTYLMLAANTGNNVAIARLLALGADPNLYCYRKYMSAYDYAVKQNNVDCSGALYEHTTGYLDVSQNVILHKIACFLKLQSRLDPVHYPSVETNIKIRKIENIEGICAGLSAIFSLKHRQGKRAEFSSDIRAVCEWDGAVINEDLKLIFFDLIQAALCMQGADFLKDTDPHMQDWAEQYKFITPFKVKNELNLGIHYGDKDRIKDILESVDFENRLVHIDQTDHRISITKEDGKYIAYDPNDSSGYREFDRVDDLINYIKPSIDQGYAIGINIFSLEVNNLFQPSSLFNKLDIVSKYHAQHGRSKTSALVNKVYRKTKDLPDFSMLSTSAYFNDIETIKDLVKFRHLVNMRIQANQNAIIEASAYALPDVICLLLDNFSFSIESLNKAFSYLMKRGLFSLIHKFSLAGVDMTQTTIHGIDTAATICRKGTYEDFQELVRHGYIPDHYDSLNLLCNAFHNRGISFVLSLIEGGHVDINSCDVFGDNFADHLLSKGFLDVFERLIPYGIALATFDVNKEDFICKIYKESGIVGLNKLRRLFADINIQNAPELIFQAAKNEDFAALRYLKREGVSNIFLLDNIENIYYEYGALYIVHLQKIGIIDLRDVSCDLLSLAIDNSSSSQEIRSLLETGVNINRYSITRNIFTLINRGCFTLIKTLAEHVTELGFSVINCSRVIFSLLRTRQGTVLLETLLKTNIFNDNYDDILSPVLENATKKGFFRTINLIAKSIPIDAFKPLANKLLILSMQLGNADMVSLYLRYGAKAPTHLSNRLTGVAVSLDEFVSMQKNASKIREALNRYSTLLPQRQSGTFLEQQKQFYAGGRSAGATAPSRGVGISSSAGKGSSSTNIKSRKPKRDFL